MDFTQRILSGDRGCIAASHNCTRKNTSPCGLCIYRTSFTMGLCRILCSSVWFHWYCTRYLRRYDDACTGLFCLGSSGGYSHFVALHLHSNCLDSHMYGRCGMGNDILTTFFCVAPFERCALFLLFYHVLICICKTNDTANIFLVSKACLHDRIYEKLMEILRNRNGYN